MAQIERNMDYQPGYRFSGPNHWEKSHLVRGERYRVKATFSDAEGQVHLTGEEWIFIESDFVIYYTEYRLHVRLPSGEDTVLILRAQKGRQLEIVNRFGDYVEKIPGDFDTNCELQDPQM